jgi:hypothetical protein
LPLLSIAVAVRPFHSIAIPSNVHHSFVPFHFVIVSFCSVVVPFCFVVISSDVYHSFVPFVSS